MGSDARIYLFDYEHYVQEVVPAAKRLLLIGEVASWWADALHEEDLSYETDGYDADILHTLATCAGIDLERHCTYLDGDLRLRGSRPDLYRAAKETGRSYDWTTQRACHSTVCPIRAICIFHADYARRVVDDFNRALETAIAVRCLGPGQFVGRSQSAFRYQLFLEHLGIAGSDPLHDLLECLGLRGLVVGYGFANSIGIHGWLTPSETEDLRGRLAQLPLPQYEATFAAMEGLYRHFLKEGAHPPSGSAPSPAGLKAVEWQWEALSLSFVRTVATMASVIGQGVLWGNDVTAFRSDAAEPAS